MNSQFLDKSSEADYEKIQAWRFYWDWLWCFLPICAMVYISEVISFKFYFLFLYFIGNRTYRMATLGHEGLHHLISKNKKWNTFLARYFCHFPNFVSHSRYKSLHSLHHRYLGQNLDPDIYLYKDYPKSFPKWLIQVFVELITLKMLFDFTLYYTDFVDRFQTLINGKPRRWALEKSDFKQYLLFWAVIFGVLSVLGWWKYFLLYWVLPIYLHLPIIQLTNGLQHGVFAGSAQARTQMDSFWLIDWFIPLDLNFHYEHHLNPRVPHYNLRKFFHHLKHQGQAPSDTHLSLGESLALLFKRNSP